MKKWATLGVVAAITAVLIGWGLSDQMLSPEEREAMEEAAESN